VLFAFGTTQETKQPSYICLLGHLGREAPLQHGGPGLDIRLVQQGTGPSGCFFTGLLDHLHTALPSLWIFRPRQRWEDGPGSSPIQSLV